MADGGKQILARPIKLADEVTRFSDEVHKSWSECMELKSKSERLAGLLRQAARAPELYEHLARRIMYDTEQVLEKAVSLVSKFRARGLFNRVFTIKPTNAFKKMLTQLDNCIADVSWLLHLSRPSAGANDDDDDRHHGLPPIAATDPMLAFIWDSIAKLQSGSAEEKVDAAFEILSLVKDNDRYGKLIIAEGGVVPLLKLVKDGKNQGQKCAATVLGLLGKHPESVQAMVQAGVSIVFAKILQEAPMNVQAEVSWAVSELVRQYPNLQDVFLQNNAVRSLVGHLAFETVEEHSKYAVHLQKNSIHSVVVANAQSKFCKAQVGLRQANEDDGRSPVKYPLGYDAHMHSVVQSSMERTTQNRTYGGAVQKHGLRRASFAGTGVKGRELEDPETKARMKAMAARALRHLANGNSEVCKCITESKALLCFAVLLEKGTGEVQFNSAMAIMEIAIVTERDNELRRSAFKPSSPAAKAVIDQLLRVVQKGDNTDLFIPSIVALGCLSRAFRASENRIIEPLVRLLDHNDPRVIREAALALAKFTCIENYLRQHHSKAILKAGGVDDLVQLAWLGDEPDDLRIPALVLFCHVAICVPDSEELARVGALTVIESASKQCFNAHADKTVANLLQDAKSKLELYQSRGAK